MKVWNSYGSEHSMNLVMIGQFRNLDELDEAKVLIDALTTKLRACQEIDDITSRYSDETREILKEHNFYQLRPQELEQFLYDYSIEQNTNTLVLTTDESEISSFLKIFLSKSAKVEVYSAHDYPDEQYGRGK
jgi:hypothetical protein